jgi:hypothetical protein
MEWNEDNKRVYLAWLEAYTKRYYIKPTLEEYNNFENLNINEKNSYIVMCDDYVTLKKFMFLYLDKLKHPEFTAYDFKLYVDDLRNYDLSIGEDDILVLEYTCNESVYGDSGYFILDKIASEFSRRTRSLKKTIILAEKPLYAQDKSGVKSRNLIECLKKEAEILYLNYDLTQDKGDKNNGNSNKSKFN